MDPLARAQALLALTAAPRTMPCRESERAAITAFVEESLTPGLYNVHVMFYMSCSEHRLVSLLKLVGV